MKINFKISGQAVPAFFAAGQGKHPETIWVALALLLGVFVTTGLGQSPRYHRDCPGGQMLNTAGTCQPMETVLANQGSGRVYWVAQGESGAADSNPGTRSQPWRTISRAASELQAGDAVIVRGGVYRESVTPIRGGADASRRTTYAAYTGEQVVISGADVLTNWSQDGGAWRHSWTLNSLYPESQDAGGDTLLRRRREMIIADGTKLTAVGSRGALVPGTFFVEADNNGDGKPINIYIRLFGDASPSGRTIEAATREVLFGLYNVSYAPCATGPRVPAFTRVIGFVFRHSAQVGVCSGRDGDLFEENTAEWNSSQGFVNIGNNHTFRGNRANDNGRYGMGAYQCNGCLMEYNQTLRNNWRGLNPFGGAGAGGGKFVETRNATIRGHEAGDNRGVGIWFDIDNSNNIIEQSIAYGNDVAGIMIEHNSVDTIIRNNVLYGNRLIDKLVGTGIFLQASSRSTIVNNTFLNNEGSGLYIRVEDRAANGYNQVYNNIFANNGLRSGVLLSNDRGAEIHLGGDSLANVQTNRFDGNLYWHPTTTPRNSIFYVAPGCDYGCHTETSDLAQWRSVIGGGDANAIIADPLFEDPNRRDGGWRLRSGSPAIGRGVTPPVAVTNDFDGNQRSSNGADLGAVQYGASPSVPPPSPTPGPTPTPTPLPPSPPPTPTPGSGGGGTFIEQGGQVVIEAENYYAVTNRGSSAWVGRSDRAGYVGSGTMVAEPDNGQLIDTGYAAASSELQYQVRFNTPGTYYVWVRGLADNDNGDSVHVGINGRELPLADRITADTYGQWSWTQNTMDNQVATIFVESGGVQTINVWMREDGFRFDRLLLTTNNGLRPTGDGPAESSRSAQPPPFLEQGGQVVIEAENFHADVVRSGSAWSRSTDRTGYVGSGAMATGESGQLFDTGFTITSPELQYQVQFTTPGTYYVWARGFGTGFDDNSLHVGLDGQAVESADRISTPVFGEWSWTQSTMDEPIATIVVSSAGRHTINVWMREDGFRFDRLLLTTDSTLEPTGGGPPENQRTTSNVGDGNGDGNESTTTNIRR